jgi:hypothetical protein
MKESKLTLQGVENIPGYALFFTTNFDSEIRAIYSDSTITILPGGGAPDGVHLWGINKKTKRSTDTLNFYNHYSPDAVIVLQSVLRDSLKYQNIELSNSNAIVTEGNTDRINNKQLVAEATEVKANHLNRIILLFLTGIIAFAGLAWMYVRKKRFGDKG